MIDMAKKKRPTEVVPTVEPAKGGRSPAWVVYARVEPELQGPVEAYINSHEYPPALARVIERALKNLLKEAGFWPPEKEKA